MAIKKTRKKARGAYLQQSTSHNIFYLSNHPAHRCASEGSFSLPSSSFQFELFHGKRKKYKPCGRRTRWEATITYYKISRITSRITSHSHTLTTCNPHSIIFLKLLSPPLFFLFSRLHVLPTLPECVYHETTHQFTEYRLGGGGTRELRWAITTRRNHRPSNILKCALKKNLEK